MRCQIGRRGAFGYYTTSTRKFCVPRFNGTRHGGDGGIRFWNTLTDAIIANIEISEKNRPTSSPWRG